MIFRAMAIKERTHYIESRQKGTPGLAVTFAVVDGKGEPTGELFDGVKWGDEYMAEWLSILGCKNPETFDGIDSTIVEIDVREEEYQGEKRVRVAFINRDGDPKKFGTEVDGDGKKSYAERMKALMAARGSMSEPNF